MQAIELMGRTQLQKQKIEDNKINLDIYPITFLTFALPSKIALVRISARATRSFSSGSFFNFLNLSYWSGNFSCQGVWTPFSPSIFCDLSSKL
jgi:hypothetical protein